jgi:hypothetical protein
LEPAFWVGKNSLRCWRRLVLEEIEGVKGKAYSEEASGSSLNCMEKAVGLCNSNYDHKMSCDSISDTCGENICDEEKALEQNCLKIPIKCKAYSGDRTECESPSISLNSEDYESNVGMAMWSRLKITPKSDNKEISLDLETRTSESLQISSCNTTTDNSQISSYDGRRTVKVLPPDLRRTFMSDTNNSNNEPETLESEVSSTVPSECEESQNVKSLHLTVCSNRAVTSSDEVSASCLHDCKMKLSEITGDEVSVPRQEVAISKYNFTNNNNKKNISGNSESQIFTENGDKVLEPKPPYVMIKTPGFGDDLIHSADEDVVFVKAVQKSRKQPEDVTCESERMVQESREESEVKTVSDVLSSDVTMDDETLHNGQQVEAQKQDDNVLCKDSDGQEDDDEGFNEDIICTHGMLNFKLLSL